LFDAVGRRIRQVTFDAIAPACEFAARPIGAVLVVERRPAVPDAQVLVL
jgi:hypothetical protein